MKEALSKALVVDADASVDRILAASFWRTSVRAAGTNAEVVSLAEARRTFRARG